MKITIERRIQIDGMTCNEASSLKHIATFTPPTYMRLTQKRKTRQASARHPLIMLGVKSGNSMLIPRGVRIDWIENATIDDCTTSYPVSIQCNTKPSDKILQAIEQASQYRGGVLMVADNERLLLGVMLAVRLGQRCLIIARGAAQLNEWRNVVLQVTGEVCGVITPNRHDEGAAFTVTTHTAIKTNSREHGLDYGMVLVDGCYTRMRKLYDLVSNQPARYRFGLASTESKDIDGMILIHAAFGGVVDSTLPVQ